jgi:hypothetical protein
MLTVIVAMGAVLFSSKKGDHIEVAPVPGDAISRAPGERVPAGSIVESAPVDRLKTGTNIWKPSGSSGRGTLRIHNGTSYDAAAKLLGEEQDISRFVYIRAGEVTTLRGIAPCQCRLLFALGSDWNPSAEEFQKDSAFSIFDDSFRFEESKIENGVRSSAISVTLHPVPQGTATTRRLSKEEFQQTGTKHLAERTNQGSTK